MTQAKTVATSEYISNYINRKYSEYSYFYNVFSPFGSSPVLGFIHEFNAYAKAINMNSALMLYAYNAEYDPTENYNLVDESYHGEKHDVSNMKYANSVQTIKEATYDGAEKDTSKVDNNEHTDKTYRGTSETNNPLQDVSFDGKNTAKFHDVAKDERHAHGNIGVSSVPDQIGKEKLVRFDNVINMIIDKIMNDLVTIVDTGE